MDHLVSLIISVIFSEPNVLQKKVTIGIGCSVGGLGLIIVCGVMFISMLCCLKLRRIKKQQQRHSDEEAKDSSVQQNISQKDKGSVRPANNLLLQENACYGSGKPIEQDIRCGVVATDDDDADYDDTVNPAELTRPGQTWDTGTTIELHLQRVDNAPTVEDGDYDDIIAAIEVKQPRRETISFETNLNPAYCSTHDCVLVNSLGLSPPELEPDDRASKAESHAYEQKNDTNLSESLSDNEAYISNDDYFTDSKLAAIKVAPKFPKQENLILPSQPQSHSADKGKSIESDHEYDYPNMVNEIQELEDNMGVSIQGSAYKYTTSVVVEDLKSIPTLPSKQLSQSLSPSESLGELNANTGCNYDKSESRREIVESLTVSHMMLCMDKFDHVDAETKSQVQVQFESSAEPSKTSPCDDDNEDGDPDYVFDRLGDCLYLDPHKIMNTTDLDTAKKSSSSVEDVHYSCLSPVTFWEGEWTQQDLLKANAIYTNVRKQHKKSSKTLNLDETLGTLV